MIAYVIPTTSGRIGIMSSLDSVPVSKIMTSAIRTTGRDDTIQQACKIMVKNDIGSIIVTDEHSLPAGIVTERDVVRHLAEKPISFAAQVHQIMSKPLVTIHPNASIRDALKTMQSKGIRRLIVASDDGKKMEGIVTGKDIFRFISRNESLSSSFVREEVLTRDRDMTERFGTDLFSEIINRQP